MIQCVLAAGLFFSAHASPAPSAEIRAAAEVSASTGPVRLILRLYKTRIKIGEKLWHQIGVQNIGKEPLLINDPIFVDPTAMESRYLGPYGIQVEIARPDGQALGQTPARFRYREPEEPGVSGLLEADTPELKAKAAQWRSEGLSQHQINLRLIKYHDDKSREQIEGRSQARYLQPQETIWTGSWFYHNEDEKRRGSPAVGPIGEFAELDFYDLDEPGRYRIRAKYDHSIPPERVRRLQKLGIPTSHRVSVATPWVGVIVKDK